MLLISGLEFGGSNTNEMALQLLADYVSGRLDDPEECTNITRLYIAGNSISHEVVDKEQHYKVCLVGFKVVEIKVFAIRNLYLRLRLNLSEMFSEASTNKNYLLFCHKSRTFLIT